jgi:hypothetical protein
MAHVEQELITLPEHSSSSRFLVAEFVLIALFFFWPLYFRSFFDVRLLITPLVSSNFFPSSLNTKKDYVISYFSLRICRTPIQIIETTFLKYMIQTPLYKRIRKKLLETTLLKPSCTLKSDSFIMKVVLKLWTIFIQCTSYNDALSNIQSIIMSYICLWWTNQITGLAKIFHSSRI